MIQGSMIRQGDVLLVPVEEIPPEAIPEPRTIVAYGEATGHHHDLQVQDPDAEVQVYALEDKLFAKIEGKVAIVHEEHASLPVEEGMYEVRIQQEYTPERARRVLD